MRPSRPASESRLQWIVALLLTVALATGLGVGVRRMLASSGHVLPPAWGGLSDTDKLLATHCVQTFYDGLRRGSFRDAADNVTPPPAPDMVPRAVAWMGMGFNRQDVKADADFHACADQVQALGWAIEQWSADQEDTGDLPHSLNSLVPTYFKTLPACPSDPKAHYHYEFSRATGQFTVYCDGKHHLAAGGAPQSPEYSSVYGLTHLDQPLENTHPRLTGFAIQSIEPDGQQAIVTVQEQWTGTASKATSTLHVTPAGNAWKVLLPTATDTPGTDVARQAIQVVEGKGLGEAYLACLATAPHWFSTASSSRDLLTACSYNLQRVDAALEAYASDHQGQYPAHLADIVPNYLRELPRCPVDGGPYVAGYESHGTDYTLCCPGGRHVGANSPDGFPRIDNSTGLLLSPTGTAAASRPQAALPPPAEPQLHASAR